MPTDSQIKAEVSEYNELIDRIAELRSELAQLEAQRERKLGRIEVLNELNESTDEGQD